MSDLYHPSPHAFGNAADAAKGVIIGIFGESAAEVADKYELPVSFDDMNPLAHAYAVDRGAELITEIADTTRDEVNGLLQVAVEKGWSQANFSDELSQRFVFSEERADLIARTEVAFAENAGAIAASRATETGVVCSDGDGDEECAAMDGQVMSYDEAEDNLLGHPNCVRAFRPATVEEWEEAA